MRASLRLLHKKYLKGAEQTAKIGGGAAPSIGLF
jgi:hypothetical protein